MAKQSSDSDLVGLYITDDGIDAIAGVERFPGNVQPIYAADLKLEAKEVAHFPFDGPVEKAFKELGAWIYETAPGVRSIGVGCYGPFVSIDRGRRERGKYGVLQPSRRGRLCGMDLWELIDTATIVGRAPLVTIETDVNVAALGELQYRWMKNGTWKKFWERQVIVFIKVSHGIGGGVVYGSHFWAGRLHPEMGHIQVKRWDGDGVSSEREREAQFAGRCGHHGDCLQGLAAVNTFEPRWGRSFDALCREPGHIAWDREAHYLAQLCFAVTSMLAPSQIIMGGRIMRTDGLIDKVRARFRALLGPPNKRRFPDYQSLRSERRYIDEDTLTKGARKLRDGVPTAGRPGVWGSLCLAALAIRPPADLLSYSTLQDS